MVSKRDLIDSVEDKLLEEASKPKVKPVTKSTKSSDYIYEWVTIKELNSVRRIPSHVAPSPEMIEINGDSYSMTFKGIVKTSNGEKEISLMLTELMAIARYTQTHKLDALVGLEIPVTHAEGSNHASLSGVLQDNVFELQVFEEK